MENVGTEAGARMAEYSVLRLGRGPECSRNHRRGHRAPGAEDCLYEGLIRIREGWCCWNEEDAVLGECQPHQPEGRVLGVETAHLHAIRREHVQVLPLRRAVFHHRLDPVGLLS